MQFAAGHYPSFNGVERISKYVYSAREDGSSDKFVDDVWLFLDLRNDCIFVMSMIIF